MFSTTSDDGSKLWVGGTLVVNNDGLHGPAKRSGPIHLQPGYYPITVTFFENCPKHVGKPLESNSGRLCAVACDVAEEVGGKELVLGEAVEVSDASDP